MCYAAHTLCRHIPQPNAATRDVRSRLSPEFHVNDSDTGGSALQHIMGHNTRTMLLDDRFIFCCFSLLYFKRLFHITYYFEVIQKNVDEAREFNELIFVSD